MRSRTVAFVIAVLILTSVGCTQRMIDFSIISSKNVTINPASKASMSEGEDWSHWFIIIPVSGSIQPSLEDAVDRAIEAAGPEYDALMDGVVYWKSYWALIVFGNGFNVRGIPINTKVASSQNPDILDRVIVHSSIRDQHKDISKRNLTELASTLSIDSRPE